MPADKSCSLCGLDMAVLQTADGQVLTAEEPLPAAPSEPEIMQTLRKVCKLLARKQRQLTDFIQVITAKKPPIGIVGLTAK